MGSQPLPALQVRPPEQPPDAIGQAGKVIQLRSLLQAAPLQQQALQQQVQAGAQENQLRDMDIKSRQALQEAGKGLDWTQPDTFGKLLTNAQKNGADPKVLSQLAQQRATYDKTIAETNTAQLTAEQTRTNMLLGHIDAIKGIDDPVKRAQESQSQGQQILSLGLVKDPQQTAYVQAMAQGQKVPTDEELKPFETGLTDHKTQLEQALKQREVNAQELTAQSRADTAKTTQQQFQAKIDPSSPLYDPSAAYLAKRAAAGDPQAKEILQNQIQQAGAKAGAEAAARFPYETQLEQLRTQTAQVFQGNKDATDKIESSVLKPYQDKMAQVNELSSAIDQAANGNIAAARAALYKTIGVAQPAGTHRVAPTEVTGFSGMGSIPQRVAGSISNALSGDPWTPQMVSDIKQFADGQAGAAKKSLNSGIDNINRLYGTQVGSGLRQDPGPTPSSVTAGPPAGATHTAPGSDGKMHYTNQQGKDLGVVPGQ